MTDDEFKRHLYRQLAEDKKNHGQLTNSLYSKLKNNANKQVKPKTKK